MTSRFGYLDDLLDQEWHLISQFVELKTSLYGRNSLHSRRQMLNAIFYLLRTGCGRHLPHDLSSLEIRVYPVSTMEAELFSGETS